MYVGKEYIQKTKKADESSSVNNIVSTAGTGGELTLEHLEGTPVPGKHGACYV